MGAPSLSKVITIDGKSIPFTDGQTIMDAALAAGVYILHLCHNPQFKPRGSCKLCTVNVDDRKMTACTMLATEGMVIENNTQELNSDRKALVQMLFVEGNHICPACEASGNCQLQAAAYYLSMMNPNFTQFYQLHEVDASHPDIFLDLNRHSVFPAWRREECRIANAICPSLKLFVGQRRDTRKYPSGHPV